MGLNFVSPIAFMLYVELSFILVMLRYLAF